MKIGFAFSFFFPIQTGTLVFMRVGILSIPRSLVKLFLRTTIATLAAECQVPNFLIGPRNKTNGKKC
jgi:hypothetical protein